MSDNAERKSWLNRCLDSIERVCNKLPPPAILFIYLFVIAAFVGAAFSWSGFSMTNPATGEAVVSQNLFSADGINWLLSHLVTNFTHFAPLGLVITMTLAIGMCDESGMILAMLHKSMRNIPPALVPYVIAFVGTLGNIASDTACVVIPPMAAIVYLGVGKHPVVGMITGYAGAEAGFTANLMIAGTDALCAGLTNEALAGFLPAGTTFAVDVTCNWFFMIVSSFMVSGVIGFVSSTIVERRFGKYEGAKEEDSKVSELTDVQNLGLHRAGMAALAYVVLILVGFFFGPLAKIGPEGERIFIGSPLLKGLIPLLFFFFAIPGIVYGRTTGTMKSSKDINKAMVKQAAGMGSYIVFCFFAGQFNQLFNWTKLGTMVAIGGADFLKNVGFTGMPMCVTFILIAMCVNLFMSSSSAKWAIFAPIFVPMFMMLGYHPGFAQLLYRLGDSPTNCMTPVNPYIWMVLSVAQAKYCKDIKIGTLVAGLLPISFFLQIAWIILLLIWVNLGLEIGPGVGVHLPEALSQLLTTM